MREKHHDSGNGCFWHTQYDTVVVEQDPTGPFSGRNMSEVTSLIGYAGGRPLADSARPLPFGSFANAGRALQLFA